MPPLYNLSVLLSQYKIKKKVYLLVYFVGSLLHTPYVSKILKIMRTDSLNCFTRDKYNEPKYIIFLNFCTKKVFNRPTTIFNFKLVIKQLCTRLTLTDINIAKIFSVWSIITIDTFIAVVSFRIVLTILTDSTSFVVTLQI